MEAPAESVPVSGPQRRCRALLVAARPPSRVCPASAAVTASPFSELDPRSVRRPPAGTLEQPG